MKQGLPFLSILMLFSFNFLTAQIDSLILKNGNVIVGEAKEMNKGVLTVETNYSDSDFKIEWDGITEFYSQSVYLITLKNGRRYNASIQSPKPGKAFFVEEGDTIETDLFEIVYLKSVDDGFWNRLYASIDLGYSFTKANNLQQFSSRSSLGYLAEKWGLDFSYNTIISTQDEADDIRRTDGAGTFRYVLPKGWYTFTSITFLSNTEQKLDLRTNAKLGLGKFLIQTNKAYWGLLGGGSFNYENFSSEDPDRKSFEAFFGTELNIFDIGDLNILAKANAYPSLTEKGRWRADAALDFKYDLPLDFYIKMGLTYNFDNRPVEGASDTDYVYQITFGWEL